MWGTASLAPAPGGFSFGPFTPVPQTQFVPFQTADPAGHGVGYIHHVTATTAQSCEEIRWQFYSQSKSSPAPIAPFGLVESEAKPDFRKEIGSLLEDTTFADVTFVLEGEEVKAHRNVLAARSPTFKAMFTSGLSESAAGAVIKLDGKNSTFRAMLQYIYSEQVSISDVDAAIDLLAMAEEYFLPGLKTECADVLVGQYLTEDTAVSLFQVANLFRAPALKEKCADFILRNTATVNLADFGKDMLAELVLVACSTKPPAVPLGASAFGPAATPRGAAFPAPPTNPFAAPAPATPACPATFG